MRRSMIGQEILENPRGMRKTLNVLLLSDHGFTVSRAGGGGAERYSTMLFEDLRRIGVSTMTASIKTEDSQVRLDTSRGIASRVYDRSFMRALESVKKNLAIDIVHANILDQPHALAFMIAARRLRLPYVTTVHSYVHVCPTEYFVRFPEFVPCNNPYPNAHCIRCITSKFKLKADPLVQGMFSYLQMLYNMHIFRAFLRRASFVVSPSKRYSHLLLDRGIPSLHLNHPIDFDRIKPEPTGDGSILFIGRLEWEKGLWVLVELAKKLPDVVIHVAGRGSMQQWLVEHSTENIICHGFVSNEAKLDLLRRCSVFVIPSLWTEMFSIVGLEALAASKPVVSFDIGGPKEQIEASGAGLLAIPFSSKDFVQKVRFLLRNSEKARNMGFKGRLWVEQALNTSEYARFILRLYIRALQRNRA